MEMVARRSPTDELLEGFNSLAEWVKWSLQDDQCAEKIVAEVIDPSLSQEINKQETEAAADSIMEEIRAVLRLGVLCCLNDPRERPRMNAVVDMLSNIKKNKHANANANTNHSTASMRAGRI